MQFYKLPYNGLYWNTGFLQTRLWRLFVIRIWRRLERSLDKTRNVYLYIKNRKSQSEWPQSSSFPKTTLLFSPHAIRSIDRQRIVPWVMLLNILTSFWEIFVIFNSASSKNSLLHPIFIHRISPYLYLSDKNTYERLFYSNNIFMITWTFTTVDT